MLWKVSYNICRILSVTAKVIAKRATLVSTLVKNLRKQKFGHRARTIFIEACLKNTLKIPKQAMYRNSYVSSEKNHDMKRCVDKSQCLNFLWKEIIECGPASKGGEKDFKLIRTWMFWSTYDLATWEVLNISGPSRWTSVRMTWNQTQNAGNPKERK